MHAWTAAIAAVTAASRAVGVTVRARTAVCAAGGAGVSLRQLSSSGAASPERPTPAPTAAEFERVLAKHAALKEDYATLKSDYPAHALSPGTDGVDPLSVARKRLLYRAKQRGWLEVDLLLGTYATQHVPTMSMDELTEFERILGAETIDIYNYVSRRDPVPAELQGRVMEHLQAWAASSPLGKASPEGYAKVKAVMSN